MTVIRRFDAVLEPTKQAVLEMKKRLDDSGVVHQDAALRLAAGQAFYNASPFTLRDLKARAKRSAPCARQPRHGDHLRGAHSAP